MQNQQKHKEHRRRILQISSLACILLSSFAFTSSTALQLKTVTFKASDGLEITADEYVLETDNPYILLFHEQGSSRGEFSTIAPRLCKMNYNCLAVDLRNGGNNNFVSNETVRQLKGARLEAGISDLELDAEAAIKYAYLKSGLPVVLLGSGANGSLGLKLGTSDERVRAVIALSPGEYFMPEIKIQDALARMKKPVFIASSKAEFPYVSELASNIEKDSLTLFEPSQGAGDRGTRSLSEDYEQNTEYWIALSLFFKDLI